jgi:prepilin-type N-terminal cleavage/methylation domain-containing protein
MFLKRIKSSSLIEVIVSLVIFSIIFGIAISIVFRLNGHKEILSLHARNVLNQTLIQTKNELTYINETIELNEFKLVKEVINYDESIVEIKITAFKNDKKIDEIYELLEAK